MSPRFVGLGVGAVVILGGLIYLFVLVRAEPASPGSSSTEPAAAATGSRSGTSPGAAAATPSPPTAADTAARGDQPPAGRELGRDIADQIASRAPSATVGGGGTSDEASPDQATQMDEANKLYDQGDYDGAQKQALRVLEQLPDSVRMRRIVVSTACMGGDNEVASKHYALLPARDQGDMTRRCERYGVSLKPTTAPAPPK